MEARNTATLEVHRDDAIGVLPHYEDGPLDILERPFQFL